MSKILFFFIHLILLNLSTGQGNDDANAAPSEDPQFVGASKISSTFLPELLPENLRNEENDLSIFYFTPLPSGIQVFRSQYGSFHYESSHNILSLQKEGTFFRNRIINSEGEKQRVSNEPGRVSRFVITSSGTFIIGPSVVRDTPSEEIFSSNLSGGRDIIGNGHISFDSGNMTRLFFYSGNQYKLSFDLFLQVIVYLRQKKISVSSVHFGRDDRGRFLGDVKSLNIRGAIDAADGFIDIIRLLKMGESLDSIISYIEKNILTESKDGLHYLGLMYINFLRRKIHGDKGEDPKLNLYLKLGGYLDKKIGLNSKLFFFKNLYNEKIYLEDEIDRNQTVFNKLDSEGKESFSRFYLRDLFQDDTEDMFSIGGIRIGRRISTPKKIILSSFFIDRYADEEKINSLEKYRGFFIELLDSFPLLMEAKIQTIDFFKNFSSYDIGRKKNHLLLNTRTGKAFFEELEKSDLLTRCIDFLVINPFLKKLRK